MAVEEGRPKISNASEKSLLAGVPDLPDGAWAEWGRHAVYFIARLRPYTMKTVVLDMEGLTIYAINPTDASLPVYRVFDFSFPLDMDNRIKFLSCAVVDSRAYVVGDGHIWVRDIGGACDSGWLDGPQLSGIRTRIISTDLFALGGKLFAIRLQEVEVPGITLDNSFEVLVDGSWCCLPGPPILEGRDNPSYSEQFQKVCGWSCIGDRRVIIHHVSSYCSDTDCRPPLHLKRFLCFQVNDDFKSGIWTWLNVFLDGIGPDPFPFPKHRLVYSSHLCSGDALVLPAPPKNGIFLSVDGFGAPPVNDDLDLEIIPISSIGWELPVEKHSRNPSVLHWHLIGMGGSSYCAIAFPSRISLDVVVLTFDLDARGSSLKNLRIQEHELGVQTRPDFLSGRAYYSNSAAQT